MIPGNGRPDSECMDLLTGRQYGLEVGAPPFVLYMPECRHNWGESLKSSKCRGTTDNGLAYQQDHTSAVQ